MKDARKIESEPRGSSRQRGERKFSRYQDIMKPVQNGGSVAYRLRRKSFLLWMLAASALVVNCYLVFRGLGLGAGDPTVLPSENTNSRSGSQNADKNDGIPHKTREGVVAAEDARQVGVVSNEGQTSRKEGLGRDAGKGTGDGKNHEDGNIDGNRGTDNWNESKKGGRNDPENNGEQLFTTNSNTPGVPDLYGYVERYWDYMVHTRMYDTLEEASEQQERTNVADLGLEDMVHVSGSNTLPVRLRFVDELYSSSAFQRRRTKVAIVSTINNDIRSVEQRVLPWIQYHVDMGVTQFYFFYDGDDAEAVEALDSLPFVRLITVKPELGADAAVQERYAKHTSRGSKFSSSVEGVQKSNEVLMTKQTFGMNEAVQAGKADHMDWLLHIDTDELFMPEAYSSIASAFEAVDASVPAIRFLNLEAQAEAGDVTAPFLQVDLFRNHQYFTTKEANSYRSKFKQGQNSGWLYLYANGKSAVRLDDKTAPAAHGPHYWKAGFGTDPSVQQRWHNTVSNSSVILHYSYMNPGELIAKAEKSCPQYWGVADVAEETLRRECFVLPLDARAFMAANQGKKMAETFFYENFVYSNGAPTKCDTAGIFGGKSGWCSMTQIADLKELMVRMQLLRRCTVPQVILSRHEQAIAAMLDPPVPTTPNVE